MPGTKQARIRSTRETRSRVRRLRNAAVKATARKGYFYAKGDQVYFRSKELQFAGDPPRDAPETPLIRALPVEGNENALSAPDIAKLTAEALNKIVAA